MELITVWDGAHGNADQDLLCCPKIPQKRYNVPVPKRTVFLSRGGGALARVEACLRDMPATISEIEHRAGLSHGAVESAVHKLKYMGAVAAQGSRKVKGMGRYETIYGVIDGD